MAKSYYDRSTYDLIDPSLVRAISRSDDWGNTSQDYYRSSDTTAMYDDFGNVTGYKANWSEDPAFTPNPLGYGDPTRDYIANRGGLSATTSYLSRLADQGYTAKDFEDALRSYIQVPGRGGYSDMGWWGDQAFMRAYGTGFDQMGKDTGWSGTYNRPLETVEQKATADAGMAAQDNGDEDWMDVLGGIGLVLSAGALGGAFGGAGLFGGGAAAAEGAGLGSLGSGTFGLDLGLGNMSGSLGSLGVGATGTGAVAAGGGALGSGLAGLGAADLAAAGLGGLAGATGGLAGVADAVGNFVPAEAVGGTGSGSGGGMDWADWLASDSSVDIPAGASINGTPLPSLGSPPSGVDFADWLGQDATVTPVPGGPTLPGTPNGLTQFLSNLGVNPSQAAQVAAKLMGGGAGGSSSDWTSVLGKLGAAGLGAYASNQQSNALAEQAAKFAEFGAPYRQQLASLQSDPGSFLSSPRVTSAVDQGTSAMARALSARDGNPVGSGRALQEMQNYATNSLYGQLTNRENQLANWGGLSAYNNSAPAANLAAVQQTGNMYNAIGAGINDIFNPQPTYLDLIKAMKGLA